MDGDGSRSVDARIAGAAQFVWDVDGPGRTVGHFLPTVGAWCTPLGAQDLLQLVGRGYASRALAAVELWLLLVRGRAVNAGDHSCEPDLEQDLRGGRRHPRFDDWEEYDFVPGRALRRCRILRRVEAAAVDQLDAVAIRIGDERDERQILAAAGMKRRLLRRTPSGSSDASVASMSSTVSAMWL